MASIAFDRAADYYDETRSFPPGDDRRAAALIAETGGLQSSHTVLEIGVGTGRIALPLSAHVRGIVGIDLARPMMERLRAKQQGERVALAQADATRLPFGAAAFDAVVAVHVFHLIPDYAGAVAEVARILRAGSVLVNCWSENFHREAWWSAWNAALPPHHSRHGGLSFSRHHSFLHELGWRPTAEAQMQTYIRRQAPAEFLDQIRRRVWSSTWPLSDAELESAADAVRAAMQTEHPDLDAPIDVATNFYVQPFAPPA